MKKKLSPEERKRRLELKRKICGTGRPCFPTRENPTMVMDGRTLEPRVPGDPGPGTVLIYNPFTKRYVGGEVVHRGLSAGLNEQVRSFKTVIAVKEQEKKLIQELRDKGKMTDEEYNEFWANR